MGGKDTTALVLGVILLARTLQSVFSGYSPYTGGREGRGVGWGGTDFMPERHYNVASIRCLLMCVNQGYSQK